MKTLSNLFMVIAGFSFLQASAMDYPQPSEYREAPEMTGEVKSGRIQPLRERLPEKPLVVGPGTLIPKSELDWRTGSYGGVLVSATSGGTDNDISDACAEGLVRFSWQDGRAEISGNIVESCEVNGDNTQFTFHMRRGLRWSDGVPVTTEDVDFAFNKMISDRRVNPPGPPPELRSGASINGEPMRLEILDTYTFRATFDRPYGAFLGVVGFSTGRLLQPKHFLKRFHIDFTPLEEMQADLRAMELGKDDWVGLLLNKELKNVTTEAAIGYPVLSPWIRIPGPNGRIVMTRNPYYFKVDTDGNQLPYIGRYESIQVGDSKIIPMMVISGKVNILRIYPILSDLPLYAQHRKNGNYQLVMSLTRHNPPWSVFLNLTNPDPTWRLVVGDLRFRQAFDLLLPRQEILDNFYFGKGRPSPWTQGLHDAKKATALLNEMGMDKRDSEGYRLAPDGQRFEISFEVVPFMNDLMPINELIVEALREAGIRAKVKQISFGLLVGRIGSNQLYATLSYQDTGHWSKLAVLDFLPDARGQFGPAWAQWVKSDGKQGEKPPDWVMQAYDLHRKMLAVRPDAPEVKDLLEQLKCWMYKNLPMFPLTDQVPSLFIAPRRFGNLPHSGHAQAAIISAEQFFFTNGD